MLLFLLFGILLFKQRERERERERSLSIPKLSFGLMDGIWYSKSKNI